VRNRELPATPVVEVDFGGTSITDADLGKLESLLYLWNLRLADTSITNKGLAELAGFALHELSTLNLEKTQVTDAGMKEVAKFKQLEKLYLRDTNVTDEGLIELANLNQLEFLGLKGTKVTKAGITQLRASLPMCEINTDAN
jgi:hypothetical protein